MVASQIPVDNILRVLRNYIQVTQQVLKTVSQLKSPPALTWDCLWENSHICDMSPSPNPEAFCGMSPRAYLTLVLGCFSYLLLYSKPPQNIIAKNNNDCTSLVAQWLRICLPMQGTRVRSLVWEDPTCCRATKPVRHNYWACVPKLLKPMCLEPVLCNKRSHCNEKPAHRSKE